MEISERSLKVINAFQVFPFKEFSPIIKRLKELKIEIFRYRDGRKKSLDSSDISPEEIDARKSAQELINLLLGMIKEIT